MVKHHASNTIGGTGVRCLCELCFLMVDEFLLQGRGEERGDLSESLRQCQFAFALGVGQFGADHQCHRSAAVILSKIGWSIEVLAE